MSNSFLRADGDDSFRLWIKGYIVTSLVPVTDGCPKAGNPSGEGVSVRGGTLCGLDELVDDELRGCTIRIAHSEINDVLTALACGSL